MIQFDPAEVPPVLARLGKTIRRLRRQRDLTLQSIAARSGMSLGYLSQVERGVASPSIECLLRVCFAFGITIDQMFGAINWTPVEEAVPA